MHYASFACNSSDWLLSLSLCTSQSLIIIPHLHVSHLIGYTQYLTEPHYHAWARQCLCKKLYCICTHWSFVQSYAWWPAVVSATQQQQLKTPITSVKVLAESLTTQEDVPVELYKEFMVDINQELDRMNKIVNDLLSLVKLDKSAVQMSIEEVSINEFIEGILKGITPIASKRNIEIIYESVRPVTAQIDSVKLGMAFSNIIENAVKYNFDNGWVKVSLNADYKFFYLRVSDSGVGIPEDLQDHIFERFYRVDKARSRETGGNGLGLAITRNAVLLHRGSIKVHSVENQGTTFAVRIPLNYQA